jgi:SAM-dependent methyltransferase
MYKSFLKITKKETLSFINKYDDLYEKKLSSFYYYPSVVRLSWFYKWLKQNKKFFFSNICVAGGNRSELELKILKYNKIFELDTSFKKKFDLNKIIQIREKFDLVLSNQVLEHLYNPFNYIKNLKKILKKNGYIFISVPLVNNVHGEEYGFYTSGYHINFLIELAKKFNLKVINYGQFGSAKCMTYTMLGHWLNYNQLKRGVKTRLDIISPILTITDGLDEECKISKFFFKKSFVTDYWIILKK